MSANTLPEPDVNVAATQTRPGLTERLLSPESLQKMMTCGGCLLVLGFVIWLWKIGVFANPLMVAAIVGGATLGTMAIGIAVTKLTRFSLAGNGLTMLGALALPLNLWLYDAQGLITLEGGGHLWVPAALCCAVYGAVAWLIRDARFVYAMVSGVVLTGMLFMADATVQQFWYLMPQVTFLVTVGWICIFAEEQFPVTAKEFTRGTFGRAFLRVGFLVLAAGLLLLAGGQLMAMAANVFTGLSGPLLATLTSQKLWAAVVLTTSTLGFAIQWYRSGRCRQLTVVTAGWMALTFAELLGLQPELNHILSGVALLITGWNVMAAIAARAAMDESDASGEQSVRLLEATHVLSVLLAFAGFIHFIGQFVFQTGNLLFSPTGWMLAFQLASTTFAVWSTAMNVRRPAHGQSSLEPAGVLSFAGAVNATFAAVTMVLAAGGSTVNAFGIAVLVVPMVAAVLSIQVTHSIFRRRLRLIARTGILSGLFLLACLTATDLAVTATPHASAAYVLLGAAAVAYLAASSESHAMESRLGHTLSGFAAWQFLVVLGIDSAQSLVAAPTVLGVFIAIFRRPLLKHTSTNDADQSADHRLATAHNLLVIAGNGAGMLLAMNRIAAHETGFALIPMLLIQLAGTMVVGLMTKDTTWKTLFRLSAIGLSLTMIVTINGLMDMSMERRFELISLMAGTVLLTMGHIAWAREEEDRDGMATTGFTLGSLLVVVPLAIGLVSERLADTAMFSGWGLFHEVAVLIAGIVLLGSGLLCRVRATTLSGAALFAVHLGSLVLLIHWPEFLLNVSVLMMLGGATFFGTGLVLSIYRDRVLALPGQIRGGQGVFTVLKWR